MSRALQALAYREQGYIWKDVAERFGYANQRSARMSVLYQARDETHRRALMGAARERVPSAHTDNGHGYLIMVQRGHPLANARGMVYVHRKVLYDAIGPGTHPCHHCGKAITWGSTLETDHLDRDRSHNERSNLVQSCHPCNMARRLSPPVASSFP